MAFYCLPPPSPCNPPFPIYQHVTLFIAPLRTNERTKWGGKQRFLIYLLWLALPHKTTAPTNGTRFSHMGEKKERERRIWHFSSGSLHFLALLFLSFFILWEVAVCPLLYYPTHYHLPRVPEKWAALSPTFFLGKRGGGTQDPSSSTSARGRRRPDM